jgi:transposase
MAGGRPTDYKPAYCNEVIEHLGEGYSLASFGGIIGAARQTIYNWADEYPEFLDAIKKGRAKGQRLWESRLANQAITGEGNTAAIIFAMKNLYQDDWADKIVNEHTGKDGGAVQVVFTTADQGVL